MNNDIDIFKIGPNFSILEALKKINLNCKGFLIVVDNANMVLGTLTDGDIRRAIIKGTSVNDSIASIYTRSFKYLDIRDDISHAIELFKNESIEFVPIIDDEKKLINIITKKQMHTVLLQDINVDFNYNFSELNEGLVDYEIYQRPWGFYKTTVMNNYFQSKVISIKPNAQLSLQSHNYREEYWIVAHGNGVVQLENSFINVKCGSYVFIPKGCKHRATNDSKTESLIITEVQIGTYFGEDDIIRYEDLYGRI